MIITEPSFTYCQQQILHNSSTFKNVVPCLTKQHTVTGALSLSFIITENKKNNSITLDKTLTRKFDMETSNGKKNRKTNR